MVHGLSLATITGRWLGETPFVQVSTTWALTCLLLSACHGYCTVNSNIPVPIVGLAFNYWSSFIINDRPNSFNQANINLCFMILSPTSCFLSTVLYAMLLLVSGDFKVYHNPYTVPLTSTFYLEPLFCLHENLQTPHTVANCYCLKKYSVDKSMFLYRPNTVIYTWLQTPT